MSVVCASSERGARGSERGMCGSKRGMRGSDRGERFNIDGLCESIIHDPQRRSESTPGYIPARADAGAPTHAPRLISEPMSLESA